MLPGPSLCTILHPAGSLLSCVISADAAIEALREIFTIVLSVSASSHLQIRINMYKIIHHFAPFVQSFFVLFFFKMSLELVINNPYQKGTE